MRSVKSNTVNINHGKIILLIQSIKIKIVNVIMFYKTKKLLNLNKVWLQFIDRPKSFSHYYGDEVNPERWEARGKTRPVWMWFRLSARFVIHNLTRFERPTSGWYNLQLSFFIRSMNIPIPYLLYNHPCQYILKIFYGPLLM